MICVITDRDIDYDKQIIRTAQAIVDAGHDVVLLGRISKGSYYNEVRSNKSNKMLRVRGVRLYSGNISSNSKWLTGIKYIELIVRIIFIMLKYRPRVVHAHDLPLLLPAYIIHKIIGSKIVYDAHELYCDTDWVIMPKLFMLIERKLMPKVTTLICPSRLRANIYVQRYRLNSAPVVIRNVCPRLNLGNNIENNRRALIELCRSKWKDIREKEAKIILYGGLISPSRGLDKVIKEAKNFDKNIYLVIVGSYNKYAQYLKEVVCKNRLENKVAFFDKVPWEEMLKFISGADGGLVVYENTCLNNYLCAPMKIYELIQCKTLIIGSDLPEINEIITKHNIGVLFDLSVKGSLSNAVNSLYSNEESLSSIRVNLEKISNKYVWETEKNILCNLYTNL